MMMQHAINFPMIGFAVIIVHWNLDLTNLYLTAEVIDLTNDILCPDQSCIRMYAIEPRYNEHNPEAQT